MPGGAVLCLFTACLIAKKPVRMNTLDHLNQTPQSWIRQQYAQQGYTVSAIHKGESLTAKVDTGFLWKLAALDAAAAKAGKSVAKLLEGGAAV